MSERPARREAGERAGAVTVTAACWLFAVVVAVYVPCLSVCLSLFVACMWGRMCVVSFGVRV